MGGIAMAETLAGWSVRDNGGLVDLLCRRDRVVGLGHGASDHEQIGAPCERSAGRCSSGLIVGPSARESDTRRYPQESGA